MHIAHVRVRIKTGVYTMWIFYLMLVDLVELSFNRVASKPHSFQFSMVEHRKRETFGALPKKNINYIGSEGIFFCSCEIW